MDEIQKQIAKMAREMRVALVPYQELGSIAKQIAELFPAPKVAIPTDLIKVSEQLSKIVAGQAEMNRIALQAVNPKVVQVLKVNPLLERITNTALTDLVNAEYGFAPAIEPIEYLPLNWRASEASPARIIEVASEGWVVADIPDAKTISQLTLALDFEARRELISNRAEEIASEVAFVVGENTDSISSFERDSISEALSSIQAGRFAVAQALSTALFDTKIGSFARNLAGLTYRRNIRTFLDGVLRHQRNSSTVVHDLLGLVAFVSSADIAWAKYNEDNGHPGEAYNRHATIHRANREQYNLVNAMTATMLATSACIEYAKLKDADLRGQINFTSTQ